MNDNESALAICPFYERFRDREIQCESRIRRVRLLQVFSSRTEAIKFKRKYCDQYCWLSCDYARMLYEVYVDEQT